MANNSLQSPMTISVKGLGEAQAELQRMTLAASTAPGGGTRNSMLLALLQLQRYALGIVHVDTGRLKNSIFTDLTGSGNSLVGRVATNVEYAAAEEGRGGQHAFFRRTVQEEGPHINSIFEAQIRSSR